MLLHGKQQQFRRRILRPEVRGPDQNVAHSVRTVTVIPLMDCDTCEDLAEMTQKLLGWRVVPQGTWASTTLGRVGAHSQLCAPCSSG